MTDLNDFADSDAQHTISESADKITFKCKTVRGNGTRDQDKGTLKVKGNDPEEVAKKAAQTLEMLERLGVNNQLREMQPENND